MSLAFVDKTIGVADINYTYYGEGLQFTQREIHILNVSISYNTTIKI